MLYNPNEWADFNQICYIGKSTRINFLVSLLKNLLK